MIAMKVKVSEIPDEGLQLTERMDPDLLALETQELNFTHPLDVSALFQKHDDDLLVSVKADSTWKLICVRCLKEFEKPYHSAFHLEIEIQDRPTIDVTDDIRQEILLSYPVKLLCREDCRGLCPSCGQDLNERSCNCHGTTQT